MRLNKVEIQGMIDEFEEGGHYVLPHEAARQLVAAIVLRALLDYRNELYNHIYLSQNGYMIKRTQDMDSFEYFFQTMDFNNYKSISKKIIAFREEIDKTSFGKGEKEKTFQCPLCRGLVTVKRGRSGKRVSCDTCHFKVYA